MNGIHDMGGLTCYGPIEREENEPVFHEEWERRTCALLLTAMPHIGPVDAIRYAMERIEPVRYLASGYYEHWVDGLVSRLLETGVLTAEEIKTGKAVATTPPAMPPLDAATVAGIIRQGMPATRELADHVPRFAVGDRVRARNLNPTGHTRVPRYVRGRAGVIHLAHGNHVFPDTVTRGDGECPQPLYNVRFDARELWGPDVVAADCLYIDLWEDYLEPGDE